MADLVKPVVKEVKILRLRLVDPAIIGVSGEPFKHISDTDSVNYKPMKMMFDKDPRFVRVESQDCVDLVPLTNVASIKIST